MLESQLLPEDYFKPDSRISSKHSGQNSISRRSYMSSIGRMENSISGFINLAMISSRGRNSQSSSVYEAIAGGGPLESSTGLGSSKGIEASMAFGSPAAPIRKNNSGGLFSSVRLVQEYF